MSDPRHSAQCPTCDGFGQVFASRDIERPELDRWYDCPDCTPDNVKYPPGWEPTAPLPPVVARVEPKTPPHDPVMDLAVQMMSEAVGWMREPIEVVDVGQRRPCYLCGSFESIPASTNEAVNE